MKFAYSHQWSHEIMVGQRMAMDGYLNAVLTLIDQLEAE